MCDGKVAGRLLGATLGRALIGPQPHVRVAQRLLHIGVLVLSRRGLAVGPVPIGISPAVGCEA